MAKQKVWTAEEVNRILVIAQDVVSLNMPVSPPGSDDVTELGDFLESSEPNPEELMMLTGKRDALMHYMHKYLTPRERRVILLRFGFETEYPMTLQEIADEYGLTRERIRQVEARALRKLRFAFHKNKITEEDM